MDTLVIKIHDAIEHHIRDIIKEETEKAVIQITKNINEQVDAIVLHVLSNYEIISNSNKLIVEVKKSKEI
jgi:hypothetical protein